jgi:hypothetical protein
MGLTKRLPNFDQAGRFANSHPRLGGPAQVARVVASERHARHDISIIGSHWRLASEGRRTAFIA